MTKDGVTRRGAVAGLVSSAVATRIDAAERPILPEIASSSFYGIAQYGSKAAAIAAGEAGTEVGQLFAIDDGKGNLIFQARLAEGSTEVARTVTPIALAADDGAEGVGLRQAGAAATSRNAGAKLGDLLTTRDFVDLQSALNQAAAEKAAITLPRGSFATRGLVMAGYSLSGLGAKLTRESGTEPIISIPSNVGGLQTTDAVVLRDIEIDSAAGGKRTGVGVLVENSAIFEMGSIRIRGADIGAKFDRCQFAQITNLKLYDNNVGAVLHPSAEAGGANSLTFIHAVVVGNKVGFIFDNVGNRYPQHSHALINPQVLANEICGIAVLGQSPTVRTQISIFSMAPEENARNRIKGGGSYVYRGITIPRSSFYCRFAQISLHASYIAEYGTTDPCIILESSSLSLVDCVGFGGPSAVVVQADRDSNVAISGGYGLVGTCHGVTSFAGHLEVTASQGALAGPVREKINPFLPNAMEQADIANFADAIGVAGVAYGHDARGRFVQVNFAAEAGNAENNCARFTAASRSAERIVVRMEMVSSKDARVRVSFYPNGNPVIVDLRANEPCLVVVFAGTHARPAANKHGQMVICPVGNEAAAIRFRNGHMLSGLCNDPAFKAGANAICAGDFNPNIPAVVPYRSQADKPTSRNYPVGATIRNAIPGPGRPIEWVHAGEGEWLIAGTYGEPPPR